MDKNKASAITPVLPVPPRWISLNKIDGQEFVLRKEAEIYISEARASSPAVAPTKLSEDEWAKQAAELDHMLAEAIDLITNAATREIPREDNSLTLGRAVTILGNVSAILGESALPSPLRAAPAVAPSTIAAAKFVEEYMDKNKASSVDNQLKVSDIIRMQEKVHEEFVSRGGALSSHAASAYYTVPVEGHRRVAARYSLGADKYGHNDWKNGDWTFILERLAHMEEHLLRLKEGGNVEDDNLGAILWGGYCLAWYEKHKPEEWRAAMDAIQGRTKFHTTTKQKEGKQP